MQHKHSIYSNLKYVFTLLILIVATAEARAAFPFELKGIDPAKVGILITDLKEDTVILDHNSTKWLVPASVMKSVTSATVLSTTSPDARLTTTVLAEGKLKDDCLDGNLIVVVTGDPTVESRHFPGNLGFADSIAVTLDRLGIKRITGRVEIDDTGFKDAGIPSGWLDEDVLWTYGTGLYGANYKDNAVRLTVPSGKTEPYTPDVSVKYQKGKGKVNVKRQRGSSVFTVTGRVPKGGVHDTYANPNPASAMLHEITATLSNHDIALDNKKIRRGGEVDTIYCHTSPTVGEILRSLMVRSDNMMAEGMLRTLAPGESRADAIEREREILTAEGMPTSGLVIEDGSGLSRNDRLSPRFLTDLYRFMLSTPAGTDYVGLFPVAGHDGTMRAFLKDTELDGRVAMKTGSMRGVQCFGGYMLDADGTPACSIVVLVNGFTCERYRVKNAIADMLLEKLTPYL